MTRPTRAVSYSAVLRLPGALRTFSAALIGRLSYATVSLALLLTVQRATHSFADAGTALGVYALASLSMPAKARLIDRFGRRRMLPLFGSGFAVAFAALAAVARGGLHQGALLLALSALAGLCAPPLGPSMRAMWAELTPDPAARLRAYSLDGIVEEALYAVGPLVVGGVVAISSPATALLLSAGVNLVGSVGMAFSTAARSASGPAPSLSRAAGSGVLGSPAFLLLAASVLALGLGTGPVEVAVTAVSQEAGRGDAVGILFAAVSVGGAAGGLGWGRLPHRSSAGVQLAVLVAVAAAAELAAAFAPTLLSLGAVLVVLGAAMTPAIVVAYVASDHFVPDARRAEASTWIGTATNVGVAAGAALAGVAVDHVDPRLALIVGACVLLAAVAPALLVRRRS